jgi:hypothetical protein
MLWFLNTVRCFMIDMYGLAAAALIEQRRRQESEMRRYLRGETLPEPQPGLLRRLARGLAHTMAKTHAAAGQDPAGGLARPATRTSVPVAGRPA